ncbi:MAG: efflux RND transporter periplasmic adaptor subunit [Muribaculaceae bacterium]|nr:efflux RND transporter periplasmic adaptor subunit [Muribaculaceae bacterium]
MKIKMTRKQMAIATLLIIIVPIIWNQISGIVGGFMMAQAMKKPKEVVVDNPLKETTNIEAESTGRVEAKYSVDVIARVSGWLLKKYFNEGDVVHKGQLLFQIDPREFQIEVNNSKAAVSQYSALLKNAQQELDRANALIKEDLISHSDVDSSLASRNSNKALLDAAKQKYQLALVNLGYTSIKSPIDGRIGKIKITEGNYVNATSGPLVNISSTDPVYVSFNLRSNDFLKLLKASDNFKDVEVRVQHSDGKWNPNVGKIDFVDNQIDQNSGSVPMRATFENKNGWLVPGDYMKVSLVAPKKVAFMTVPQSCTKGDAMSGYYVWTVKDDKAVRRDIKVSDAIETNWIVTDGLDYSDTIVVAGIQNIAQDGQALKIMTNEEYMKTQKEGKK